MPARKSKKIPKDRLLVLGLFLLCFGAGLSAQSLEYDDGLIRSIDTGKIKQENSQPQLPSSLRSAILLGDKAPNRQYQSFDSHHKQAFFCRLEWQWEQTTALPVKFRLGSVEYVNALEGKPHYRE